LGARVLQALDTIRSERQLMERIDFDLLFARRGLLTSARVEMDQPPPAADGSSGSASTMPFAACRPSRRTGIGFLEMNAAAGLLAGVVNHPDVRRQLSRDHFSVDGTLIDARRGLTVQVCPTWTPSAMDDWPPGQSWPRPFQGSDRRPPGL
jgi:hypothetical protein